MSDITKDEALKRMAAIVGDLNTLQNSIEFLAAEADWAAKSMGPGPERDRWVHLGVRLDKDFNDVSEASEAVSLTRKLFEKGATSVLSDG